MVMVMALGILHHAYYADCLQCRFFAFFFFKSPGFLRFHPNWVILLFLPPCHYSNHFSDPSPLHINRESSGWQHFFGHFPYPFWTRNGSLHLAASWNHLEELLTRNASVLGPESVFYLIYSGECFKLFLQVIQCTASAEKPYLSPCDLHSTCSFTMSNLG